MAIVHFDVDKKPTYDQLVKDAIFVKLDAKDQIQRLGRTVTKSTLEWWNKQSDVARRLSFEPADTDIKAEDALDKIRSYIQSFPDHDKTIIWSRGGLDALAVDSLARAAKVDPIAQYWAWRDVRTAVDCLTGSSRGYCDVDFPGFSADNVIKHDPRHDCAYDIMMLLYGKTA